MGGCFSDVKGGKQAVGVGGNGAHNDALDLFYKSHQMFTQLEVLYFSIAYLSWSLSQPFPFFRSLDWV